MVSLFRQPHLLGRYRRDEASAGAAAVSSSKSIEFVETPFQLDLPV
jgi:hypothetical protein